MPGPTRVFAEIATRSGAPVPRPARQTVLLVERENHVNRRVDINRVAIEKSRLIAPLAHSIKSGLLQQRVSGENFQGLNRAVLADDGVQADRARDACLARGRRWRGRRGWRRGEHGRHHGLWKRLSVNQWNQNQDRKKCDLKKHRDEDRPRLIGLLRIRTRNHHLFKHRSYLLPAEARRAGTLSPPRVLFPAAGPVPAATPRPRQRFQATTSGAAIPKLEYVPTTIPTTRAKEKARSTWPPIRNKTSTVRKVKPLVKIVRERV